MSGAASLSGRQQTPRSSSTVCHELNAASSLKKCRRTRWPILPAAPSSSPRLRYSVKASARGDRAVGGTVPCPAVFSSCCLSLFPHVAPTHRLAPHVSVAWPRRNDPPDPVVRRSGRLQYVAAVACAAPGCHAADSKHRGAAGSAAGQAGRGARTPALPRSRCAASGGWRGLSVLQADQVTMQTASFLKAPGSPGQGGLALLTQSAGCFAVPVQVAALRVAPEAPLRWASATGSCDRSPLT